MQLKKPLGLLLAGLLATTSLVGCSQEGATSSPASETAVSDASTDISPPDTDEPAPVESTGEEIEITLWHHWQSEQRRPTITAMVDRFNEENAGKYFCVSTPVAWADFDALLMASIASGDVPDVVVRELAKYVDYAENGIAEDLTDYVSDNVLDRYDENFKDYAFVNGRIFALPFVTDDYYIYYNKDILEEAGVADLPQTWEDFYAIADLVDQQDDSGNYEIVTFLPGLDKGMEDLMNANGGGIWNDYTNPTEVQYNHPRNVEAMAFAKSWSERYGKSVWLEYAATMNQNVATETNDIFIQGKVAMVMHNSAYVNTLRQYGPDMNLGAFPIPDGPSANGDAKVIGGGFSLYVPKGCKNMEAAVAYAEFMTDDWASAKWGIDQTEIMCNKSVIDAPELQENELFKVALSVVPKIVVGVAPTGLSDRRAIDDELRDNVMGTDMSAQDACDKAQQDAVDTWEQNLALGEM